MIIPEYIELYLPIYLVLSKEKSSRFMAGNTTQPCSAGDKRNRMLYKVTRWPRKQTNSKQFPFSSKFIRPYES